MRTAEDRWRMLDPVSYREHLEIIKEIRYCSRTLADDYGFDAEYPLAERLIEAFGKHVRDGKRPHMKAQLKALHKSLNDTHLIGSMDRAPLSTHVRLALLADTKPTDAGSVRKAIREADAAYNAEHPKGNRGGRHEDITNTLIRTLLIMYARGTGKILSIAHPTKECPTYRGQALRFVCECLDMMGACTTRERVADLAQEVRNHLNRKKK